MRAVLMMKPISTKLVEGGTRADCEVRSLFQYRLSRCELFAMQRRRQPQVRVESFRTSLASQADVYCVHCARAIRRVRFSVTSISEINFDAWVRMVCDQSRRQSLSPPSNGGRWESIPRTGGSCANLAPKCPMRAANANLKKLQCRRRR